jgi:hypothetical protein
MNEVFGCTSPHFLLPLVAESGGSAMLMSNDQALICAMHARRKYYFCTSNKYYSFIYSMVCTAILCYKRIIAVFLLLSLENCTICMQNVLCILILDLSLYLYGKRLK